MVLVAYVGVHFTKDKALVMNKQQEILQNRLAELCKEKNLSYYTLSYKADVPLSTVLNIRDGKSKNPGIVTIMKLCDGLGITMKEFFDTKEFEEAIAESRDEK